MLEETHDTEELIERVAALDIGKAELVCCVRVPGARGSGRRQQEVQTYPTMTRQLLVLADRLRELGVTRVVMEATSDYWKAPFYLLEAQGFQGLAGQAPVTSSTCPAARRPTGWTRCGCARSPNGRCCAQASSRLRRSAGCGTWPATGSTWSGSAPPRSSGLRSCCKDAQIKLSVVASDIFGASGRAMLAALITGERNPKVLAQLARGRLRAKRSVLEEAFTGQFTDHHAFLLAKMLARVDEVDADITELDHKLEELIAPFAPVVDRLDEISGIGRTAAQVILAEVGLDMNRFPTAGHLASWAKFTPGVKESAGKKKGTSATGHGNRYLARVLGEAAVAAGRTDTFLGERYRRIARRRGTKRAVVAVGRSILVIVWHLLADPDAHYQDLGADFYDRHVNADRAKRTHIRQLEPSATRSPSNPPPDRPPPHSPGPGCADAPPGAAACLRTGDFRIRGSRSWLTAKLLVTEHVRRQPDARSSVVLQPLQ